MSNSLKTGTQETLSNLILFLTNKSKGKLIHNNLKIMKGICPH